MTEAPLLVLDQIRFELCGFRGVARREGLLREGVFACFITLRASLPPFIGHVKSDHTLLSRGDRHQHRAFPEGEVLIAA